MPSQDRGPRSAPLPRAEFDAQTPHGTGLALCQTAEVPTVEAEVTVPVRAAVAFAVSQTHGEVRYRWDPFVREQHFLGGAAEPGKGVQTFTGNGSG